MSDDEDRAARLRRRRQRSSAGGGADADDVETGTDERDDASTSGDAADAADLGTVKDEQVGTYMYLPEWQKREIERVYGLLSTEYEYRYDEEFEKNRHFYPLLVAHGLDELDGLDAEAVRERLSALRDTGDE